MNSDWQQLLLSLSSGNNYLKNLNINTEYYQFHDMWSTDIESQQYYPQDIIAIILVYPLSINIDQFQLQEQNDIFFIKQYATNSCVSIAIFHAILNNYHKNIIKEQTFINQFYLQNKNCSKEQKGNNFKQSEEIYKLHQQNLQFQQQEEEQYLAGGDRNCHCITFIKQNDDLYLIDGLKQYPINLGKSTDFLKDTCQFIYDAFLKNNPYENFRMLAYGHQSEE